MPRCREQQQSFPIYVVDDLILCSQGNSHTHFINITADVMDEFSLITRLRPHVVARSESAGFLKPAFLKPCFSETGMKKKQKNNNGVFITGTLA